jgi:threonine dehydrogenase-like Zn-dependent dehydrogenase
MRAVVLTSNKQLEILNVEKPTIQSDECLLSIKYAGICSSDIYRAFDNGAYFYPLIMGHEFSGEIISIGTSVVNFEIGDRVVAFPLKPCFKCDPCQNKLYAQCVKYDYYGSRCNGAFSEFLNVKSWNLLKVPEGVSLIDACLLEPLAVVLHGITKLELKDTESQDINIMLIGTGFLGFMLIDLLSKMYPKIKVDVVDRNQFKLDLLTNKTNERFSLKNDQDWEVFLKDKKSFYRNVIELSGFSKNFERSIELTKQNGKILWLSNITGNLTLSKNSVSSVLRKEIKIIGSWNSNYKSNEQNDWEACLNLLESGYKPSNLVTKYIQLEEMPDIIHQMYSHKEDNKKIEYIKYVVDINDNLKHSSID